MNRQKIPIYKKLETLEKVLESSFPILPNSLVVVRYNKLAPLIDEIYASVPMEVQEAKKLLERREEIQIEAQQRAERIILDAQNEANRLLSESDILRQINNQSEKIKEQVIAECKEIDKQAREDAEKIRSQAADEAARMREGAEVYAQQVLAKIEHDLTDLQQVVKNGQVYFERMRSERISRNEVADSNPQVQDTGAL